MRTIIIIEDERAVRYLGFVQQKEVVNHLPHDDFSCLSEITHFIEIDAVQHESCGEDYLPLAADNEVAVVILVADSSEEDEVGSLVDDESLEAFGFFLAAERTEDGDGGVRLTVLVKVDDMYSFVVLEDSVSRTEHFHRFDFGVRVLGIGTDMPVGLIGDVCLEAQHRFLVNHRSCTCVHDMACPSL